MTHPIVLSWLSKWLQAFFPIRKAERKKIFFLLLLKFLISFVYCILTALKDTVLITAQHSAAEVIPVVKGIIILPLSIGILLLYTTLNNHLKQTTLFYSTILFFMGLMLLYGFVLYPNAAKISPHALADQLNLYMGVKYFHWIAALRHWIHVCFYVIAEFWGQITLMILYWGFVNQVCTIQDAKRFYALLIAAGDVALIVNAPIILNYTQKYKHLDFVYTVQILIGYAAAGCLAIMTCYWWVNRIVQQKQEDQNAVPLPGKLTLSLWKSFKHVAASKYLANIAIMMIACGLTINIVEGTGKSYLKEAFPTASAYQSIVATFNFWTGVVAVILSLFFSGGILRRFGWKVTAQVPPITAGVMGCLLFLMSYSKHTILFSANELSSKITLYIALLGGMHTIVTKSVKYAFFDKTIQIAYIPLDPESKVKGKAAVDLLGSRLGKAGSSWIHIILLRLFDTPNVQDLSGILFIVLAIASILWYRSIHYVDQELHLLEKQADAE